MTIQRGANPKFPQESDPMAFVHRLADEYRKSKDYEDAVHKRTTELRAQLIEALKEYGTPDDKGHLWLDAHGFTVKHERRVSSQFQPAVAMDWAEKNSLVSQVTETVTVVVEDKVLTLAYERPDLNIDLPSMYKESESWALKVTESK